MSFFYVYTGYIGIKYCTDIHGDMKMSLEMNFHLALSAGQVFHLSSKTLTMLISSTVFCADIHGSQRVNPYDFGESLSPGNTMTLTSVVLTEISIS